MTETYTSAGVSVGRNPASSFRICGKTLPSFTEEIVRIARNIWPRKTDFEFSLATGASERTARNWLEGSTSMSVNHAAALLHGEHGYQFARALLGGAKWWDDVEPAVEIARLEAEQERVRERIAALKQSYRRADA